MRQCDALACSVRRFGRGAARQAGCDARASSVRDGDARGAVGSRASWRASGPRLLRCIFARIVGCLAASLRETDVVWRLWRRRALETRPEQRGTRPENPLADLLHRRIDAPACSTPTCRGLTAAASWPALLRALRVKRLKVLETGARLTANATRLRPRPPVPPSTQAHHGFARARPTVSRKRMR